MSVTGIASSILSALTASQSSYSQQGGHGSFASEFQQLGQDLQSGNLSQAQSDFSAFSEQFSGLQPTGGATAAASTAYAQELTQLGKDLQSGNLQAAKQDYTTLQQQLQQTFAAAGGHRHHHHIENSNSAQNPSSTNPIVQAFSTLAQDLQAGSLSGAQSAFATLQNDLQQIGGFATAGLSTAASASPFAASSALNITV
jgi:outer membrane protein assembly factor BamD (BamD/ComL family)